MHHEHSTLPALNPADATLLTRAASPMIPCVVPMYACACRLHTVHYEELVSHPRATMARVLKLCGLPWEDGVLQFHTREASVATASLAQVGRLCCLWLGWCFGVRRPVRGPGICGVR